MARLFGVRARRRGRTNGALRSHAGRGATTRGDALLAAASAALLSFVLAGGAAAQTTSPPPTQAPPAQATPEQSGPIVGGHRIQPRADQVDDPAAGSKDDETIRQLYREVLDASDPANINRRREHQ